MAASDTISPAQSVLQGIDRLYQVIRLYDDPRHIGVRKARDVLQSVLGRACSEGMRIEITAEGLLVEGVESPEGGPFWEACRDQQLATITLAPSVTSSDLARLATLITDQSLLESISEATGGRITFTKLNLRNLQTGEVESKTAADWQSVIRSLADDLAGEIGWTPEQAHVLNEAKAAPTEVASALREQVRVATAAINQLDGPHREQNLRRLRTFIKALNPKLRQALVAQQSDTFTDAQDTLAELADVLPLKEVLEALRQVSASTVDPSTAALRMFHQLARTCVGDQDGAAELQHLTDTWRTSAFASDSGADALLVSIGELLQSVNSESYCPEQYLKELDQLGQSIGDDANAFRLPTEQETSLRVSEISATILKNSPDGLGAGRMLRAATGSLVQAIHCGRHAAVRDLVRAARNARTSKDASKDANAMLDEFAKLSERVVRSAFKCDDKDATLDLLEMLGEPAIGWSLTVLGSQRTPNTTLWTFLHKSPARHVGNAIEKLTESRVARLPSLARLCQPFDFNGRLWILWPILDAPSEALRIEAYQAVGTEARRWPLRLVARALADSSEQIQILALEQMGAAQGELESRLVGGFLEGLGNELSPDSFDRAAHALLSSKDPHALKSFHTAFLKLLFCKETSKRIRAARLAQLIQSRRDHPILKDAWSRWRFSSSRLHAILRSLRRKNRL